ncbi:MAG: hypothetical protein L0216_09455 [Planctomycetales bacterium]|nr:hypothetical protein [Planctomycetales bacterium]
MRSFMKVGGVGIAAFVVAAGCQESDDVPPRAVVNPNAFALQTGFPSDIEIVGAAGLDGIGFVYDGNVVQAVRLGAGTLSAPVGISGFTVPSGFGFGDDLLILSASQGLATTSSGNSTSTPVSRVFVFNPTTGNQVQNLDVARSHTFPAGTVDTQGATVTTITQANVAGVAYMATSGFQGKLYVVMSNAKSFGNPSEYFPGTVQVFAVDWSLGTPVATTPTTVIRTTDFNATHATPFVDPNSGDRFVLLVNTGKVAVNSGVGAVTSAGSVDVVDADSDAIVATLPLGNAGPSFSDVGVRTFRNALTRRWESRGLLGGAVWGHLYEVDLSRVDELFDGAASPTTYGAGVLHGASSPLVLTSGASGNDYIVEVECSADGRYAFASSFNLGEIRVVDFGTGSSPGLNAPTGPYLIGNPATFVSANALELRPGTFTGPEVFALTGAFPGPATVASVETGLRVSGR